MFKMNRSSLINLLYLVAVLEFEGVLGQAANQCVLTRIITNGYITNPITNDHIFSVDHVAENFDEVKYGCVSGYTLVGNTRNICVNGHWVNPQPKCELLCSPKNITSPTFLANCHIQQDNKQKYVSCADPAYPGTVAQINCQRSYENRKIEHQIVTCGNDGRWHPFPEPCMQICGEEGPEGSPLIVGGVVTNLTKVPWNVGIYHKPNGEPLFQQTCGGTIVNARVVISAMHCFWDRSEDKAFEISEFRVVAGKFFREFESEESLKTQTFSIDRLHRIETYEDTKGLLGKDIAVLILNTYLDFSTYIAPACLDYETHPQIAITPNVYGRVAGWGLESTNGLPSPVLKLIELPVIDRNKCIIESNPNFVPFITDDKFCAGYLNGSSVCQGDSGAGLVIARIVNGKKRFYLKGIVSAGANKNGSCDNNKYTTFTNIANYSEFIMLNEIPHRPENSDAVDIISNGAFAEVQSTSCKIKEIPINGFVSLSSAPGDFLKFDDTVGNQQLVEYTCINNLTLIGKSRNICFKGMWVYEVPSCSVGLLSSVEIRNPCRIDTDLYDGWIEFAYSPFTQVFFGDVINSGSSVKYHCKNEFELVGRDNNICLNGVWDNEPPRCAPTCLLSILLDDTVHQDYTCHLHGNDIPCLNHTTMGSTIKMNCRNGLTESKENVQEITCESDGQWSPKLKPCASACGRDSTPWEVFIFDEDHTERCRGKILSPRSVLASVYCFWSLSADVRGNIRDYRIVVGEKHESEKVAAANTYLIQRLLYDKYTYKSPDIIKLVVVMLKRPIEFNNELIPICLYPGTDYENALRLGIEKAEKFGDTPDITVHTKSNGTDVEVHSRYWIYKTWVATKIKKIEGIVNKYYCGDGVWEGESPQCILTCPLSVLNDLVFLNYTRIPNEIDFPSTSYVKAGTILKIQCSNDSKTAIIQETTCGNDGQWTIKPTSCISTCGNNGVPWRALIFDGSRYRKCRGKILTPKIILASPYCFWTRATDMLDDISTYRIVVTDSDTAMERDFLNSYGVESVRYVESYKSNKPDGGFEIFPIGLAVLNRPIMFNDRPIPICLYLNNDYEQVLRQRKSDYLPDFQTSVYHQSPTGLLEIFALFSINDYKNWVIPQIKSIEGN